jgi:SNF2 family DNA or RNA helicase
MLVVEKAKALALKLNNPERVLATIPTAKRLVTKGGDFVVTPHNLDEVRVLRNLGIQAPSPILHYYNWPGRFSPYHHQKQTAAFLTVHPRALVLNQIGTGKTKSALWAADYLMDVGAVKKVLIISPLSTLERVWSDEIFTSLYHRKGLVLHGTAARRKKLLNAEADFYIINHDGFGIIADDPATAKFDLLIVDEAAVLRNPSTRRFKVLKKYMEKHPDTRLWLMTGTPTPNEPTDAWSLGYLVRNPNIAKTHGAFKEQVMYKAGMHRWTVRPESAEIVRHVLQPSVIYQRDECFDLPDTIFQTRHVELTDEQKHHFKTMRKHLIAQLDSGEQITAVNEAVKMQKLIQIACGVAYGDDKQRLEIDASTRVAAVEEIIEEAGEKVILFVPLTGTLHMLEKCLSKRWPCAIVNGEVSASKRADIFYAFQNHPEPKVLIAHPATMAHGLTLTAASTVIWYGPITSNEQYVQANGRVERIGKKHISNVVNIEATALERELYKRLAEKQSLQGLLLDLLRQDMED